MSNRWTNAEVTTAWMTSLTPHLALSPSVTVCPYRIKSLGTGRRRRHGRLTAERFSPVPMGRRGSLPPNGSEARWRKDPWFFACLNAGGLVGTAAGLLLAVNVRCPDRRRFPNGGFHRHPSHKPDDGYVNVSPQADTGGPPGGLWYATCCSFAFYPGTGQPQGLPLRALSSTIIERRI